MPGFNQKGPMGEGPMTGRKMGRCTNFGDASTIEPTAPHSEKNLDQPFGTGRRGSGLGRGCGRGRGRMGRGPGFRNSFRNEF
jgi:hypothetical protein